MGLLHLAVGLPLKTCRHSQNSTSNPLLRTYPTLLRTPHILYKRLRNLRNQTPFPKIVSWFPGTLIAAMFPNIDNNLGITAIADALNSHVDNFFSTDCIVVAVQICLEHNNSQFQGENCLQIHGTAMGPQITCSYADCHEDYRQKSFIRRNQAQSMVEIGPRGRIN